MILQNQQRVRATSLRTKRTPEELFTKASGHFLAEMKMNFLTNKVPVSS